MAAAWVLVGASFFAGLAAGFLGGLCLILRPVQGEMGGREFHGFMETFLRYADSGWGKAYNYAWSLGMGIGPIVALVLLRHDPGSASFVLTAIGLVIVLVGVYVVSNVWKTPQYKVILAWDPDALPTSWEADRQRYFNINWIQLATTWSTFILFLIALLELPR